MRAYKILLFWLMSLAVLVPAMALFYSAREAEVIPFVPPSGSSSSGGSSGGGGGGGGGAGSARAAVVPTSPVVQNTPKACVPQFVCGDWSDCQASVQVKVCNDEVCGATAQRQYQSCSLPQPPQTPSNSITGQVIANPLIKGSLLIGAFLVVGILTIGVFYVRRRYKEFGWSAKKGAKVRNTKRE